jgi:hypothetical protein
LSKTQLFFLLLFALLPSAPLRHEEIPWAERSLLLAAGVTDPCLLGAVPLHLA